MKNKEELLEKIEEVRREVTAAIADLNEIKSISVSLGKELIVLENYVRGRFIRTSDSASYRETDGRTKTD